MRPDLTKQLCERQRLQSYRGYYEYRNTKFNDAYKEREPFDEDDSIAVSASSGYRESMKRRYGWDTKVFGEHLSPLYGAIRKYVGRKWDDFYSDLCRSFDRRSVTGQHIFQHLYDRIADPATTHLNSDGQVVTMHRIFGEQTLRDSRCDYFVDPRDGIIKVNKHYRSYKQRTAASNAEAARETALVKRVVAENEEYHKVGGVWYHFTFKTQQPMVTTQSVHYEFCTRSFSRTITAYQPRKCLLAGRTVEAPRYAVTKRQASKKEIKHYSLPQ